jgi:hypothetical protein
MKRLAPQNGREWAAVLSVLATAVAAGLGTGGKLGYDSGEQSTRLEEFRQFRASTSNALVRIETRLARIEKATKGGVK